MDDFGKVYYRRSVNFQIGTPPVSDLPQVVCDIQMGLPISKLRRSTYIIQTLVKGKDTLMLFSNQLAPRRIDVDICSTAQAPLAAEGRPNGKQHQANQSISLPLCPQWQIANS